MENVCYSNNISFWTHYKFCTNYQLVPISRNLESGCQYHLSKKTAEPEWFATVVMSGPTRHFPNWGLLSKIALRVLKSSASCSGEIDSLICLGYRSGSEKQNQRLTITFFCTNHQKTRFDISTSQGNLLFVCGLTIFWKHQDQQENCQREGCS